MTETPHCPECGTPIAEVGAPQGLCPGCLLERAAGGWASVSELDEHESAAGSHDASTLVGATLDSKYRLERVLGTGGMGAVYLAMHLGTHRPVALKVIAPRLGGQPEFVERFRREAEATGRLRHPNIVNVTDFGFAEADGMRLAYLVMEYLDGMTLAESLVKDPTPPIERIVDILEQICSAVDEAHRQGIIHRDLKPANIWLEPDRRGGQIVKVLDFGLAKLREVSVTVPSGSAFEDPLPTRPNPGQEQEVDAGLPVAAVGLEASTLVSPVRRSDSSAMEQILPDRRRETGELTRAGTVLGTPGYMSPEQCLGRRLDARTDIYSIGVIAYEMLAGRTPFTGELDSLISQHIGRRPLPPSALKAQVPKSVEEVVLAALAKHPNDRPSSASAFARSFGAAAATKEAMVFQALRLINQHASVFGRLALFGGFLPMTAAGIAFCVIGAGLALRLELTSEFAAMLMASFGFVLISFLFNGLANGGLYVPVVAHLQRHPDRPVRVRSHLKTLASSLLPYLAIHIPDHPVKPIAGMFLIVIVLGTRSTGLAFLTAGVLTLLLLLWRGFGGYVHAGRLMGPVIAFEGLRGMRAHVRADELARRLRKYYGNTPWMAIPVFSAFLAAGVTFVLFPYYLVRALADETVRTQLGDAWVVVGSVGLLAVGAFGLLVNALVGVCFALAYLKARDLNVREPESSRKEQAPAADRVETRVELGAFWQIFWGLILVWGDFRLAGVDFLADPVGYLFVLAGLSRLMSWNTAFYRAAWVAAVLLVLSIPNVTTNRLSLEYAATMVTGDLRYVLPGQVGDAQLLRITDDRAEIDDRRRANPTGRSNAVMAVYSDGTKLLVLKYKTAAEAREATQEKGRNFLEDAHGVGEFSGSGDSGGSRSDDYVSQRANFGDSRYLAMWGKGKSLWNPLSWNDPGGPGEAIVFLVEGKRDTADAFLAALHASQTSPEKGRKPTGFFVPTGLSVGKAVTDLLQIALVLLLCLGIESLARDAQQTAFADATRKRRIAYTILAGAMFVLSVGAALAGPSELLMTLGFLVFIPGLITNLLILALLRHAARSGPRAS